MQLIVLRFRAFVNSKLNCASKHTTD